MHVNNPQREVSKFENHNKIIAYACDPTNV